MAGIIGSLQQFQNLHRPIQAMMLGFGPSGPTRTSSPALTTRCTWPTPWPTRPAWGMASPSVEALANQILVRAAKEAASAQELTESQADESTAAILDLKVCQI